MKNRIISMSLLLTFFATSCLSERFIEAGSRTEVKVNFSLDNFNPCRSSSASPESEIRTLQLFVVDSDGDIVDEDYRSGSTALSFKGRVGETYHLYAFANNSSRIEGFETEDDILEWEYRTTLSGHFPSGFPMAGDREWTVSERGGSTVVELVRLVSKLVLTLDTSEMDLHGVFTLNSVKLRNCPSGLKPFVQGQKALDSADVGDGDLASADDLAKLNAGESVCFYILENMQGDLLPSNGDPWQKIPSNLSSEEEALCTYLEASGSYISPGYDGSDSYRMYLGKDNVSNFDLCRNNLYRLTLSLTEDNMRKDGNWKITASDWTDTRSMSFSPSSVNILPGNSRTVTLSFSPSDFDFDLTEEGFSDAKLSYTLSGNTVTLTCGSDAVKGKTATLTATSWDGRVQTVCNIRVGEGATTDETLTISPKNPTIKVGESLQFKAYFHCDYYLDGEKYNERTAEVSEALISIWSVSAGEDIVSITNGRNDKGLVTGLSEGRATVLCFYAGTMDGSFVYVEPADSEGSE